MQQELLTVCEMWFLICGSRHKLLEMCMIGRHVRRGTGPRGFLWDLIQHIFGSRAEIVMVYKACQCGCTLCCTVGD